MLVALEGGRGYRPEDPQRQAKLRDLNRAHRAWIEQMLRPSLTTLGPDYVRVQDREPRPDLTPVEKLKPSEAQKRGAAKSSGRSEAMKRAWVRRRAKAQDAGLALAA